MACIARGAERLARTARELEGRLARFERGRAPSTPPPLPVDAGALRQHPRPCRWQRRLPRRWSHAVQREIGGDAYRHGLAGARGRRPAADQSGVPGRLSLSNTWSRVWGPSSKVALLYVGAGTLAGVGAWLERSRSGREMPTVRNYARVLLAGGLAAVYYVTYAAHYYPNLRVIGSPLLAGTLLLGWAAFMVWVADRRGSETVATFAILLAYYTSAVNEIAGFTLVSNLPLTAGAVFLLRRHLWKIFPFASLLATFGSYAYWRYFHLYASWQGLPGASTPIHSLSAQGFWVEAAFPDALLAAVYLGGVFGTRRNRAAIGAAGGICQPEQRRVFPVGDLVGAGDISRTRSGNGRWVSASCCSGWRRRAGALPQRPTHDGKCLPARGRSAGDAGFRHVFQRLAALSGAGRGKRGAAGGGGRRTGAGASASVVSGVAGLELDRASCSAGRAISESSRWRSARLFVFDLVGRVVAGEPVRTVGSSMSPAWSTNCSRSCWRCCGASNISRRGEFFLFRLRARWCLRWGSTRGARRWLMELRADVRRAGCFWLDYGTANTAADPTDSASRVSSHNSNSADGDGRSDVRRRGFPPRRKTP